jgi:hypothetical protein
MYEATASCKDITRAPVACNVTRLRYAVTLQLSVQLVSPYRVTHLQRYEVTLCGNITSVDPP